MTHDNAQLIQALRASMKDRDALTHRLQEITDAANEPIAIIATGCRLPGGIASPDALWEVVSQGLDVTGPLPTDRGWQLDPTLSDGTPLPTRGGFLDGAAEFDAGFFNISPNEAVATDPQHRLLLEVAWEVLERAGIRAEDQTESPTGVFVGSAYQGYGQDWYEAPDELQGPLVAGMSTSIMSGRIAYTLGLRGPALTVDTACSSSLTAIHLAVASLRSGECDLAFAGGAAVITSPIALVGFARQNGVASDGRCKAFGAGADGMGLGEGVGLVLLERLSSAQEKGHEVLAIIRGTAANQDGASNGISAPNGPSQVDVMRRAVAASGLEPGQIDAVETHGTGTRLGDPIEGNALIETFGPGRPADRPLWIGSLKSNLGHAQGASGVASVIKAVESLRHGVIPASLHCDVPSPLIDWDAGAVRPASQAQPFADTGEPHRMGVSSFGLSGTNVHLVLEQAPAVPALEPARAPAVLGRTRLWVVTARSRRGLVLQAERLLAWLDDHPDADPGDVAWTLATARTHHEHRAVVVGSTLDDLAVGLRHLVDDAPSSQVVTGRVRSGEAPTAFLFPGQGSQHAGMARRLLSESATFAEAIDSCGEALAPYVDWDLRDVLTGDDLAWQDRVDIVQPVLWASMVALARVWESWGVTPSAVIGHSQGEIAAACVAGHLSLADAARVVALRSQALVGIAGQGGMVSVQGPVERVRALVDDVDGLALAVVNSDTSTVVSGDTAALDAFLEACPEAGLSGRRVQVDYASHSPAVSCLEREIRDALVPIAPRDADVPLYSTVRGDALAGDALGGDYWYENLRSTVQLDAASRALVRDGLAVLLECSVHPVLGGVFGDHLDAAGVAVRESLRRDRDGLSDLGHALAALVAVGVAPDWGVVLGGGRLVRSLPTRAFDHRTYWLPSRSHRTPEAAPSAASELCYRVRWEGVPTPLGNSGTGWLVLAPGSGVADELAERVARDLGDAPVVRIDPDTDLPSLLAERTPRRVASLLALDESPAGNSGRSVGLTDTLRLLQAADGGPVVWHLTRGAVADAGGAPSAQQAAVQGLVRIATVERPGSSLLLDLPAVDEPWGRVLGAILGDGLPGEDQLLLRSGRVLVRRLERVVPRVAQPWTPRGTGLVVGGTSGLGAEVARWLAAGGSRRVVVASRRGPETPGADELLDALRELGAEAEARTLDIADADAVASLVSELGDLRTVVSCAGVLDDALIGAQSTDSLDRVLAAKAAGVAHLDAATRGLDLDAFVAFSSMAGTLGGPGQGNYSAANCHVDALMAARRAAGLPGTALAWGAVEGGGLADPQVLETLRLGGIAPVTTAEALAALETLVADPAPHTVVARVDWERIGAAGTSTSTLAGLVPSRERVVTGTDWSHASLLELACGHVAEILGFGDPRDVDADRALRDLGFDSVTVVDLRRRLTAATGVPLSVASLFDHPSASALARHLAERLGLAGRGPVVEASAGPADHEPLAVVGMAVRLPGGIDTPEGLWELLERGGDVVGGFPTDRGWDLSRYNADRSVAGTFNARAGSFLQDPAAFDPAFFGISPREATTMDPQQRLLLESAWETFESAGIVPAAMRGTDTGVYLGISYNDYGSRVGDAPAEYEGYLALGSASSVASGRISYTFGLQGPAVSVDTACSSSMVALALACQALRDGTCSSALVGGATVMSTMTTFIEFARQGAGSEDGRCRAFSDDASGAGWAEGVGMILIEPLSKARAEGHPVLGTIVGVGMNQDGASNGLTAPSGTAQAGVIRAALADAGVPSSAVQAVEAHGTGTELGDPIEASALTAVYGGDRRTPLWLGSLKSNIGHTQAASGLLGIIKLMLALRHGCLPRTLHAAVPSSHIEWDQTPLQLLQEPVPWPSAERRLAGASSFGISGTNVHVIVGDPPEGAEDAPAPRCPEIARPIPWVASGRSEASVRARLGQFVDLAARADLVAAGRSLARHAVGEQRAVVVARDADELRAALAAFNREGEDARVITGAPRRGQLGWVFSGQGSQCAGMGAGLADVPGYRDALDDVLATLRHHLPFDLADAMETGDSLTSTDRTQPAIFAHQVALGRLLLKLGLRPDVLTGHSIGEYAALHLAGVLDLEDAARLIAARGRLMAELPEGGVMLAVRADLARVQDLVAERRDVSVAAVNGPESVVVSGAAETVDRIGEALQEAGIRCRRLDVSHAFHSPLMVPMMERFVEEARSVTFHRPTLPVVSSVTGEPIVSVDAEYLVDQVRATVRFADAVRALGDRGVRTFVELGAVSTLASQIALNTDPEWLIVPLQRGGREDQTTEIVRALATLDVAGHRVDWEAWFGAGTWPRVELPPYPFDRQRYWLDATASDVSSLGLAPVHGQLLSGRVDLPSGEVCYTADLATGRLPWLTGHHVGRRAILPATGYLELCLEAARDLDADGVRELTLEVPLVLESAHLPVRLVATPGDDGWAFEISSSGVDGWRRHASGTLGAVARGSAATGLPTTEVSWSVDELYATLAESGFDHEPAFRGLTAVGRTAAGTVLSRATLPSEAGYEGHCVVHPALLDAALQGLAHVELPDFPGGFVPFTWRDVAIDPVRGTLVAELTARGNDRVGIVLKDADGAVVGWVGELVLRATVSDTPAVPLLMPTWRPVEPARAAASASTRVVQLDPTQTDPTRAFDAGLAGATAALTLAQDWLTAPDADTLAVVTRGATGDQPDLGQAAAWGLIGSAINEHPGLFRLVDLDPVAPSDALAAALAVEDEPILRVTASGEVQALRLASGPDEAEGVRLPATWVVTGAGGTVGGALAEQLAAEESTRTLVLLSRRGRSDASLCARAEELERSGVAVEIVACDVTDPDAVLAALEASAPQGEPVGVVHAAGVLDDGVVQQLTADRLARVMRTKVGGALNLLGGVQNRRGSRIVLVSSIAGVLGGAGQGSYAAANVVLDALARSASARGLEVRSQQWGLWAQESGMTATVTAAGGQRAASAGVAAMDDSTAKVLFARALRSAATVTTPAAFDRAALARARDAGTLVPALAVLVPAAAQPSRGRRTSGWVEQARMAAADERRALILRGVRGVAAEVLGHADPRQVPLDRGLLDVGFDSLTAVELRNRLSTQTSLRLPATLLFDHPTLEAIATYVDGLLTKDAAAAPAAAQAGESPVAAVEAWLDALTGSLDGDTRRRLRALSDRLTGLLFDAGDDEELMAWIDEELGV